MTPTDDARTPDAHPEVGEQAETRAGADARPETAPVGAERPATTDRCPCRSRLMFGQCCGPYLSGATAPSPETLMRSRFTGYALRDLEHVRSTWHPSTLPADLTLRDDTRWVSLQIVETTTAPDGRAGSVHFRASFRTPHERGVLEEASRFVHEQGRWWYLDGRVVR